MNKDLQKAVQEKIITKRNERYVIPIKTDFKSLVKGIEHDRSSTGSTVYMEPLNIVSLNNKLREYEAKEREEIRKILIRITEIVRSRKEEIERKSFQFLKTNYIVNLLFTQTLCITNTECFSVKLQLSSSKILFILYLVRNE